ncbi:MAG: hypothetical protein IPL28_15475 [Chloroflexi bacterium]|nr:hypothetical protein [Chloroflexota bacterium]
MTSNPHPLRIFIKAAVLFLLCNALFAAVQPLPTLGRWSLYGHLYPSRLRLPYGEDPQQAHNLTLTNLPAMLASHAISQPKAADEFRVVVLGDSAVWGWLLPPAQTLIGQLNQQAHLTSDGRRIVFYNLGYPLLSLTKDVLLLQEALAYEPDMFIWLITLQSCAPAQQMQPPLVQHNGAKLRPLIASHRLPLATDDPLWVEPSWWERTIVGQRRPLADLLRLQLVGASWAATGIDQAIPPSYTPRQTDLAADNSWQTWPEPTALTAADLSFDVLRVGIELAGDVPLLLVNEPMFVSTGANSDLRYNSFYPRWAYDAYRGQLAQTAVASGWLFVDLWDGIPPAEFTDSPVHLSAVGNELLAAQLGEIVENKK